MRAKLSCKFGPLAGEEFEISKEATIGTDATNSIVLKAKTISGQHARIFFDEEEQTYFLEDLGSSNGTKLDGTQVKIKERLSKLHTITFAKEFKFFFQVLGEQAEAPATPQPQAPEAVDEPVSAGAPEKQVAAPPVSEASKTVFDDSPLIIPSQIGQEPIDQQPDEASASDPKSATILDDDFSFPESEIEKNSRQQEEAGDKTSFAEDFSFPALGGDEKKESESPLEKVTSDYLLVFKEINESFKLKNGENTIGRGDTCDISLSHPSVSNNHARLTIKPGQIRLRDLGSKNKTFVQNKAIDSEIELKPGTRIVFGAVEAKLVSK